MINVDESVTRYCSVENSIDKSMQEVKLMRENKIKKKKWKDYLIEQDENKKQI